MLMLNISSFYIDMLKICGGLGVEGLCIVEVRQVVNKIGRRV